METLNHQALRVTSGKTESHLTLKISTGDGTILNVKRPDFALRLLSHMAILIAMCYGAAAQVPATPPGHEEAADLFEKHCISCHTINFGERVATDLKGITRRRDNEWLISFIENAPAVIEAGDPLGIELFAEYEQMVMPALDLSRQEIESILSYIEAFEESPPQSPQPEEPLGFAIQGPDQRDGLSLPGLIFLAATLTASGVLWKLGRLHAAQLLFVAAIGFAYWSLGGRSHHVFYANGNDQGYAPEQPIAFAHTLHAADLRISCVYCHNGADKNAIAGIPALSTCMNCHAVVKKTTDQTEPSPDLAKLATFWQSKDTSSPKSIEWLRVHDLADFVYFNHQMHVNNNIQCQECHGPIQSMDRIRQASDLTMNWCIECHRQEKTKAPTHWKSIGGPQDCSACHQ